MQNDRFYDNRPSGVSSRVRRLERDQAVWHAPNGQEVVLPVIVDHINIDGETGACIWLVEAIVGLVEDKPGIQEFRLKGEPQLDLEMLQRFFRWKTPLDIVTRLIPGLLDKGIDPYSYFYPVDGFPEAADLGRKINEPLSDEFLKDIARQYVEIGKGYARVIADQKGVSERTVVSWIEKARKRGILEQTVPGKRTNKLRD